jgi:hypothetical protein
VGCEDGVVGGVDDGVFDVVFEEVLGVGEDVLVEGTVVTDENGDAAAGFAAGATDALPEGLPLAGVAHEDGRVEAPDVDAEFQRRGRGEPGENAGFELVFAGVPRAATEPGVVRFSPDGGRAVVFPWVGPAVFVCALDAELGEFAALTEQ